MDGQRPHLSLRPPEPLDAVPFGFLIDLGGRGLVCETPVCSLGAEVPKTTTLETEQVTAENAADVYAKLGGQA